jgi:protein-histidine pros-kinase
LALKESEEKFRALAESANDGIVTASSGGEIVYWNRAAEALFGHSAKEALGMPFMTLLLDPSAEQAEDFRRAFAGGTSKLAGHATEWTGRHKEGRTFPTEISLHSWFTDQGVFSTATIRDITERKQIDDLKRDVIAMVSHQLKTPAAEINGYIENLLDGLAGDLTERQREYLQDMRDIGLDNYRLISDLLSVSKIERGVLTVDPRPVPLRQILELALRDYEEAIRRKGLDLRLEIAQKDARVMADPDKTVETLRNLINNAVKCTDKGSISLSASQSAGFSFVEVRDTGIGMGPETLSRLFTRDRIMGQEAGRSGAGLGLYIAKHFMNLQGGDIMVTSEKGKGTVFTVRIPNAADRGQA